MLRTTTRQVALALPLFLVNVVLLSLTFSEAFPPGTLALWAMVTTLTGSAWALLAWVLRRPRRAVVLALLAAGFTLVTLTVSLESGWFLATLHPALDRDGQILMAAAVVLLAATGMLVAASYPPASLAWIGGLTPALLTLFGGGWHLASGILWGSMGLVLLCLVAFFFFHFRSRLRAEDQAAYQGQLVGLLLHDFGEGSEDWVWETDVRGRLRSVSPRLARQLARDARLLNGLPLVEALAEDRSLNTIEEDEDLDLLGSCLSDFRPFHDLEVPAQIEGRYHRWKISARPVFDVFGKPEGWLGVGTDITEVQRIHNLNARLALLDALTGLANRHRFQEVLHDAQSPRSADTPLGLILIDLQAFRMVNEGLGHEAGDNLLKEVAQRLRTRVPPSALLARLGGDEFALLAPGTGKAELEDVAASLRSASEQPFVIDDHRLEVSFHMGMAVAPVDAQGAAELLKCAELALHEAKVRPQGYPVWYRHELSRAAHDRIHLHNELKVALAGGQFELHYQPQIRVFDGALAGAEALVRWRHPTRGMVSPAEFIPALEETGLIVPVGAWILEEACREAQGWPSEERVAVNVSAVQFASRSFLESVRGVLAATSFPPSRLELEITESVVAQDPKQVDQTLRELRSLGIAIALDDFGTGYSSLSYLRQLPLDKLKVDQSFVRAMDQDANAAFIIQAVLDLSRALGLRTTAEGVETEEQRARLSMLGVDLIQGYFYSRPLSAAGLREFRKTTESS